MGKGDPSPYSAKASRFVLWMALLIASIGIVAWTLVLMIDYRREVESANAYGQTVLDALGQHMKRLVETNELLLSQFHLSLQEIGVDTLMQSRRDWEKLRSLTELPQNTPIVGVFDTEGNLLLSTRAFQLDVPAAAALDLSLLDIHQEASSEGLLIGPTIFSPVDGKPYLLFSRRWEDQDGTFRGVIAAGMRADVFLDFAENVVFGPKSTVSFIRDDGLVLIRRPLTPEVVRLRLDDYELFTEYLQKSDEGSYDAVSPADGEKRVVYYSRLPDLPVIAIAGLAWDEVLAGWWRRAYQSTGLLVAGLVGIGTLGAFGLQHARRAESTLQKLVESREHQQLLLGELGHRVKNLLAIVQSIVYQSARAATDKHEMAASLSARLQALAASQDLLTETGWQDVDLRVLVEREVLPFSQGRIEVTGEPAKVPADSVITLALLLHELATNATKHGSLSNEGGILAISWETEGDHVILRWEERGSGTPVAAPSHKGFGMTLLQHAVQRQEGWDVSLDFRPGGLLATIQMRLGRV